MPRIIIMHDNGTEEIQDFCVWCVPTVDEIENHCRERGDVQWVQHNAVHADYAGKIRCSSEKCQHVLLDFDNSAGPLTTIIPINGRLNYAAG